MKINAVEFDEIARKIFKPVYPVIAAQILVYTGIAEGCCLDIGCGGGYLGIELARASNLAIYFLDQSSDMIEIVKRNISVNGLQGRGETILANVEKIPMPDNSVNLAVSRGSIFFWDDLVQAFREIYRVLAPGGITYIGGGFGSAGMKEEIINRWQDNHKGRAEWQNMAKRNLGPDAPRKFERALKDAAISNYEIVHCEEKGLWIIIRKES
ncbi:MAG: class I SAM-dependent methyltransferase [Proteobacteria bacterium]|nr:class I SAM-dependent methyltransferase [Pseudomonadota bacterium]